jgi:hypothetical protein
LEQSTLLSVDREYYVDLDIIDCHADAVLQAISALRVRFGDLPEIEEAESKLRWLRRFLEKGEEAVFATSEDGTVLMQ